MPTPESLVAQFEQHRAQLRAVAHGMLGSASETDNAVDERWIRFGRTEVSGYQRFSCVT
jgi:DNA-directed RNA polymerase specialized sigma24 family protein